jgi:nitroreductase
MQPPACGIYGYRRQHDVAKVHRKGKESGMDFLQVVEQRRSVREYLATAVDSTLIEQLLATATLAPSSRNQQPWMFAYATGAVRISDYGRRAKEHALRETPVTELQVRQLLSDRATEIFHHAPALVLVVARTDSAQSREDCCLAAQTFMLAARAAGLGTCWVGFARPWLNTLEAKAELTLPTKCHVVAPIVLGYPRAWPPAHGRHPPEIHRLGQV